MHTTVHSATLPWPKLPLRTVVLWLSMMVVSAAMVSCGGPEVRVDETTVAGHEAEAQKERRIAEREKAAWDPSRERVREVRPYDTGVFTGGSGTLLTANPTDRHLQAAEAHRRHAAAHEHAAMQLQVFLDVACAPVAPSERIACPTLITAAVDWLPDGIRLHCPPERVEVVLAEVRCHLAFARAHGYNHPELCPFALPQVEAAKAPDGSGIDLTSKLPATVKILHALDLQTTTRGM